MRKIFCRLARVAVSLLVEFERWWVDCVAKGATRLRAIAGGE